MWILPTSASSRSSVAGNANADALAESGGEESEEEWNYIPGKDTKTEINTQEQEDMSSQLNPNAAEFVPVSPTKLLMMDDAIISASPRMGFEKSMDNVLVPSELEFNDEVSRRPSDLGITNGPKPKHGDNYFMRDNFSSLRNKSPDLNSTSTCAQLGDDSIGSLSSSVNDSAVCASEDVPPFNKLEAVKNLNESKDLFGSDTDFANNAFGVTNVLDKLNHLSTSEIEHELMQSPENEDNLLPGTPKSTTVEAPVSPDNEEELPLNHQTDFDSPTDDNLTSPHKSSDVVSESALALGQDRKTSSSGFESDNGAEEGEINIAEDSNEGFVTEHRRSPPIDLSFKPIQTFSDTNPFGALQTPSSTTPLDHNEMSTHIKTEESGGLHLETPQKSSSENFGQEALLSFNENTPSSFISVRPKTPFDEPVPFNELESPTEIPQFELPPNANSSMLASELPKSPNPEHSNFEEIVSSNEECLESEIDNVKSNHLHSEHLDLEESSPKYEETSFTTDIESHKEAIISSVDLDTTAGFLHEESNILNDEKNSEQSKLVGSTHTAEEDLLHIDNSTREVEPNLIDECNVVESEFEPHTTIKDTDFESETKEMNLEFESHIPSEKTLSEDLGSSDDGFEVISKEELKIDEISAPKEHVKEELNIPNLQSSELHETPLSQQDEQTNPFHNDEHQLPIIDTPEKPEGNKEESLASFATSVNNDFMNIFENVGSAKQDIQSSEKSEILSPTLEPQVLKTESYQLLTPADEPICTKTVVPVTEDKKSLIDDEIKSEQQIQEILEVKEVDNISQDQAESCPRSKDNANLEVDLDIIPCDISLSKDEPVLAKSEPVQSQVVTETLITALEETSEVPSLATTEVPSTAGTPPPTPIPTEADSKDDAKKTDLLVAAVAAAGAVATGAVLAADKAKKEPPKKPIAAANKKPNESTVKAPTKPALSKASKPAAATKTTTTKPATAATKPTGPSSKPAGAPSKPTTTGPKPAPTKPASAPVAAKKPAALTKPATAKPASTSSPKPASTISPKPATTSAPKTVPKHLPVNKTAAPLKSTSKPTTPTSKPTTPTAPKSPSVMKSDVKSPARPAVKSTLTANRPTSTAKSPTEETAEKKPMTNGDVKPAVKKVTDGVAKKPSTTTSKPLATTRPSAPVSKTAPVAKAPTSAGAKPLASKPASTVPPKTKPSTTAATKPTVPPPIRRPTSGIAAKTADKTGKDIANKQLSSTKAVNGKVVPSKTVNSVKKTDAKINGKTVDKPSKNPEEVHAENESHAVVQEDNVTTTNGFGEHDHIIEENGSMKIEELSPVILENVN